MNIAGLFKRRRADFKSTTLVLLSFVVVLTLWSAPIQADHCPEDRPFHRGNDACDSCDWREVLAQYDAGELSTTRSSRIFEHDIRVNIVCDANRTVDVDEVFEKIDETEEVFIELLKSTISLNDGRRLGNEEDAEQAYVLQLFVGICDDDPGRVDDCVMHRICREVLGAGCDVSSGIAYRNSPNDATHSAFIPYFEEGKYWWIEGNRYGNLQHEYTHLLDYTYFRMDARRGSDTDWWAEGLPQYVQWSVLNDGLSWRRGNNEASMLEAFTHRENTSDYYDGMRLVAFLHERAPRLLTRFAETMREGVYSSPNLHLDWHNSIGFSAWLYQAEWEEWTARRGLEFERVNDAQGQIPGFIDESSD